MLLVCITPSIKTGPVDPKIPAGFTGIADLLGVLEHFKFALNVAFFVRHEYFLHPKSGNLQEVSRESVHSYNQTAALKKAGCEIVRSETGSGASRDGRTELETIFEFLRKGDELAVHRLDRLGRSTPDVLNLVHELDAKGASLRVLEPEVSIAGDLGRMVVTVLGMVADMELKFIRDRQRAGIDTAKEWTCRGLMPLL